MICIVSLSLGAKCDPDYAPPDVEECTILSKKIPDNPDELSMGELIKWMKDQTCYCTDKRLPDGHQKYTRPLSYCRAYQATNPRDYAILADHWDSIVRELKECNDKLIEHEIVDY